MLVSHNYALFAKPMMRLFTNIFACLVFSLVSDIRSVTCESQGNERLLRSEMEQTFINLELRLKKQEDKMKFVERQNLLTEERMKETETTVKHLAVTNRRLVRTVKRLENLLGKHLNRRYEPPVTGPSEPDSNKVKTAQLVNNTHSNTFNKVNNTMSSKQRPCISETQGNLRRAIQEVYVAFSVYLNKAIDHLGAGQPIKYDQVLINDGQHYNIHTGTFTVPVDGVYAFSFYVSEFHIHQIHASLSVDGVRMVDGIADSMHDAQDVQGGNFAILRLQRGQAVWVQNMWADSYIYGSDTSRFDSFSGYLLYQ